jgi:hypothetical protein
MTDNLATPTSIEALSDAERSQAVARAIKACSQCPGELWSGLASYMAVPGVALTTGLILKNYPETEWAGVVSGAYRLSKLISEILETTIASSGAENPGSVVKTGES